MVAVVTGVALVFVAFGSDPKTLRITETTQTEHTHGTHSLILWVPDLLSVQILDYRTETFDL